MQDSVSKDRDKFLGGSDIPIIMNLSPFKSRFDLLLEKAGYKEDEFKGNVYTEYGNTLEPIIRDFINSTSPDGARFVEGKHTREAEDGEPIGVRIHTDGENENAILEIKTTSQIYNSVYDYKLYLVQLLYYMVLTGKPYGLLAVYERPEDMSIKFEPRRLHLYKIAKDEEQGLINEINRAIELFIEDLQKVKANPFITESDLLPAEIPDITERILAFESQLAYFKKIEKTIKSEKDRLKKAMQAASVKSWTTPNGYKITLVDDTPDTLETKTELDEKSLRRDLPEIFRDEGEGGYMVTKTVTKKGARVMS
jgi:predicted phage-related endonuclease